MIMKLPMLACVAAALWVAPVFGQEGEPEVKPGMQVRGLSFQLPAEIPEVYMHDAAAEPDTPGVRLEVKDYLNHEASAIQLKGTQIIFTKKPEGRSAKDPGEIVATLALAKPQRSIICMFVPGSGAEGAPPCRIFPIEDDTKEFPRGSLKVMNLSPLPVRIQLENQNFDFNVGEVKVITDPPVGANHSSGMQAFRMENNEWQRIAAGVWPHPGRVRVLQILFLNPASGQIELKGIRDISISG